jgi:hypothetical protein
LLSNEDFGGPTKDMRRNGATLDLGLHHDAVFTRHGLARQNAVLRPELDQGPRIHGVEELRMRRARRNTGAVTERLLRLGPRLEHRAVPIAMKRRPCELDEHRLAEAKVIAKARQKLLKRGIERRKR